VFESREGELFFRCHLVEEFSYGRMNDGRSVNPSNDLASLSQRVPLGVEGEMVRPTKRSLAKPTLEGSIASVLSVMSRELV